MWGSFKNIIVGGKYSYHVALQRAAQNWSSSARIRYIVGQWKSGFTFRPPYSHCPYDRTVQLTGCDMHVCHSALSGIELRSSATKKWFYSATAAHQPSGHYMYHQFNIKQFYVLPTQCIYVFCVDLRTNSDYLTVQHWLVVFYNWDGVCLLRGTFYILRSAHRVYLCVLCGSENKQRLFHSTAMTGWFL